jgi:Uma2 family endonuclease
MNITPELTKVSTTANQRGLERLPGGDSLRWETPLQKLFTPIDDSVFDAIVTEDDTPVDNFPSAKQQRLLVESLYSSWQAPDHARPFLADTNVGVFAALHQPPLVPDVFLSLGVQVADDWWQKRNRSYFISIFGKPPDVVIEMVSNQEGGEEDHKRQRYARMGIPYYIIFDPTNQLYHGILRVYERCGWDYVERDTPWLPQVGLGVTLWQGTYEGKHDIWLRWCDENGNLILTGAESVAQERLAKERILFQLEHERHAKEQAFSQLEQLNAKLRALGIDPNGLLQQ